ncbi:hypothetical protein KUTeg_024377 [Tegillarca granosa]|uniref:Cadherin domain-containing protein n=1 Tax=Tegillarca granosa TaxID=220873 RepID=A0ABQ9DX60_TEGGR|nr:hypothetical protein KUTeg_024377 [Tegillarca granosa]
MLRLDTGGIGHVLLGMQKYTSFLMLVSKSKQDVSYELVEESGPDTYLGKISESANLRERVQNDSDFNSLLYNLLPKSDPDAKYFNINPWSSSLFTSQSLDRDIICPYKVSCILEFHVVAQYNSIFIKLKVSVNLLDINDNAPRFPNQTVNLEISEESIIGSSITLQGAQDADSGNNSKIRYRLLETNTPFSVESGSYQDGRSLLRIIVKEKIDREIRGAYTLTVIAEDSANEPKNGTLIVNLKIKDINDNRPKFEKSVYRININESAEIGYVVMKLSAYDPDEGENGRIIYSLSSRQSTEIKTLFHIDATTGELSLIKSLIDEHNKEYHVIVEASDNAKTRLISQTEVFINVLDTHNKAPEITVQLLSTKDYIEKSENTAVGTVLGLMFVRDPDSGNNGRITCYISGDQFGLTSDKSNTEGILEFNIVLKQKLDRELKEWHTISITCKDSGSPSLNTTRNILLHVLDTNDNPPRFQQQVYKVNIPENGETDLVQLTPDTVDTGNIVYSILVDLEYKNYFTIDRASGMLTVQHQFDRETTPQINIQVFAEDNGSPSLTGTAIIETKTITAPVFSPDEFKFAVAENQPPNVSVGRVIAHDIDADDNGVISFSMAPDDRIRQIPFIVMQNGTILAEKSLDRETINSYEFIIRAIDGGVPPQTSTASVKINIQDVNDETPKITFPSTDNDAISISYETLPNVVIATISAEDADEGMNGDLFYSFEGTNSTNLFQLNRYNGQITLRKSLDLTNLGTYILQIRVEDGGQVPNYDTKALSISVTDTPQAQPQGDGDGGIKYFAIAIAISCVTVVLSILIILAICLIRRRDHKHDKFIESVTTSSETEHANMDMKINGVYSRETIQKSLVKSNGSDVKSKNSPFNNSLVPKNGKHKKPEILTDAIAIWDWGDHDTTCSSETQRTQSTILPVHHSLQDLYNTDFIEVVIIWLLVYDTLHDTNKRRICIDHVTDEKNDTCGRTSEIHNRTQMD